MNFTNLAYFMAAAEELNITKAAQRLYISPQSLSNHIARLEEELNIQLFERDHGLKLTYAGKCTLNIATKILDLNKQLQVQINDIINLKRGSLSIGLISRTRGRTLLPTILPRYHQLYPDVELHVEVDASDRLVSRLRNGEFDLIFNLKKQYEYNDITILDVYTERMCLIASDFVVRQLLWENPKAMLNSFESGVDINAFQNAPFLMMKAGTPIRKHVDRVLSKCGWEPNIILESTDLETLLALVQADMGVTFAYEHTARHNLANRLSSRGTPIHLLPMSQEFTYGSTVLSYRNSQYLSKAAKDFIFLTMECYGQPIPIL